jgi:hypothetical protein
VKETIVLDAETYDVAERAAAEKFPNRILQAFYPEMFATLGYPARVERVEQLWRYIDVMHETRTEFNTKHLLHGLTTEEFELFKRVTRLVDQHTTRQFAMRAHPTAALLRAIHVLRLIKIVTGSARPTVLEVGPGCGYLAMLLVMEGFPYVGTDVVQAFYLYQNQMLSLVAENLRELAAEDQDQDILSIEQPQPGTAIHIPWWKWVTLTPDKIRLSAGIMTSNHVLCEMHPSSMAYLAVVGRKILANDQIGGKFVFDNWGYNLLHTHESVARKFADYGLHVCHDEDTMTAMVLTKDAGRWLGKLGPLAVAPAPVPTAPISAPQPPAQMRAWRHMRPRVVALLNQVPPLKRAAVTARNFWRQLAPPSPHANPVPWPSAVVVGPPDDPHPLSRQLMAGRAAVIGKATIHLPELQAFLVSHFDGKPPQLLDETFLDLIGTRF